MKFSVYSPAVILYMLPNVMDESFQGEKKNQGLHSERLWIRNRENG